MENPKKAINIFVANNTNPQDYITFLNRMFEVTVITHDQALKSKSRPKIDLVLFTGGEDVDPDLYGEKTGKFTSINKGRDNLEQNVWWNFDGIPKLGICRGAQFVTVMSGGKLVQHVTGHGQEHMITIEGCGNYPMTSTHHQMMYPYNMSDTNYKVLAYATNFKSNTYLNGDNEEINLKNDFLEPEIVEYPNTKSLCIQGHPEFSTINPDTLEVITSLISNWFNKLTEPNNSSKYNQLSSKKWMQFLDEVGEVPQYHRKIKLQSDTSGISSGSMSEQPWRSISISSSKLDQRAEQLRAQYDSVTPPAMASNYISGVNPVITSRFVVRDGSVQIEKVDPISKDIMYDGSINSSESQE